MSNSGRRRRPAPMSIRFSEPEKALLQRKAGSLPLGTYIREAVLGPDASPRAPRRQAPIKDGEALGRLLGLLGQSRLANNLNQLAKAVNTGSLPVTPETEADLNRACAEIAQMRDLLLKSLGIIGGADAVSDVAKAFWRAVEDRA